MPDSPPQLRIDPNAGLRIDSTGLRPTSPPFPAKTPLLHSTRCCGLLEIDNLGGAPTPAEALQALSQTLLNNHNPFILFTGIVKIREGNTGVTMQHPTVRNDDYGQAFADYIVEQGIGTVVRTDEAQGITGNTIRVWVWKVGDRAKIRALRDSFPAPSLT